jgi:hypothetical protein
MILQSWFIINVTDNHIPVDFKGRNAIVAGIVRDAIVQNQESAVVIMDFASRIINDIDTSERITKLDFIVGD